MEWSESRPDVHRFLAVSPSGDIVVLADGITVLKSSGDLRWSMPSHPPETAITVAPDGTIWEAGGSFTLYKWASDGTPLDPIEFAVPDGADIGLTVDTAGYVISVADVSGGGYLGWSPVTGIGGFNTQRIPEASSPCCHDAPNTIATDGRIWWTYSLYGGDIGYGLRSYDTNGGAPWAIAREPDTSASTVEDHDLRPLSSAKVVLVGDYIPIRVGTLISLDDDVLDGGFIQIFGP
jgi:hypothetical protein